MVTNIAERSRTSYSFIKHSLEDPYFTDVPAVYIYVRQGNFSDDIMQGVESIVHRTRNHPYCYIGETEKLRNRMQDHRNGNDEGQHLCALKNGASFLLVHFLPHPPVLPEPYRGISGVFSPLKARLEEIEKDLLDVYNTPCNKKNN